MEIRQRDPGIKLLCEDEAEGKIDDQEIGWIKVS